MSDAFKFDCAVVILDFLIRHGHILPGEGECGGELRGFWQEVTSMLPLQ